MRAWLNNQLWTSILLLLQVSWISCGKSNTPAPSADRSESLLTPDAGSARTVPRRTQPLVITNRITIEQKPSAPLATATNSAPVVTCAAAQTLPCSPGDGLQVTLTAHVEDADGNPLNVIWSTDGKERSTQQVAGGESPTSTEITFVYTMLPGDHAVRVTVTDGSLTNLCETTLTVEKDSQPPVIACPRDIVLQTDPGQCTATVTFTPRATDNCGEVTIACEPPPGAPFPIGVTTVTCTATDVAGNASDCSFDVAVRFSNRCPKSDAFWRQNPGAWPVNSITLGNQVYSRSQLLPLLRATTPADASILLARQLIAATLNTAAGADPRPVCAELAQANGVLGSFGSKLPYRVNVSSAAGRSMLSLSTKLNGYNNGMMSSDCVP